ncbi:DNA-binding response regulator [[Phormidium ambiguum] IAM M-71]|uniref:DNA-binding response regulator n=1 Tax=[Phormidium ambiguum] IAM M-71 TaxID=454136 RepID=A0A1U7IRC2_9CYAN|nr:response regulator transcription factor [Phormidium ambiguum]OKH40008.1 DNA-binding response regulator [Phormidium ambiguum IAM M-71]
MNRILIAEDETHIVSFLEKGFKANGFSTAVAKNGHETVLMARSEDFDLLILDIGIPGKNGWIVLEELRKRGEEMPIVILTARDGVKDKVAGLEGGADDYVTKPFGFEELLARVRLRLRDKRSPKVAEEMILKANDIVLDLHKRQVKVSDRFVELSAREFTLAEIFLNHPGELLSREELLDRVWGYDYDPGSNIVDVYVGYLRKKLGGDRIETVRGKGYRLRV